MLLHKHWLKNELTQLERSLLLRIAQHQTQMHVDLDVLQCMKLHALGKKMQQMEADLADNDKDIYSSLKQKLIDFTNLQLQ